jgi:hypothetical protein
MLSHRLVGVSTHRVNDPESARETVATIAPDKSSPIGYEVKCPGQTEA